MILSASFSLRRLLTPLIYAFGCCLVGIVLTRIALIQPFIAIALGYVTLFVTLAWKRPDYALMLVFIGAPFQPDVSGGGFAKASIAEVNLLLLLPIMLIRSTVLKCPMVVGPIFLPVCAYLGVCIFSSSLNSYDSTVISILQMMLYFFAAVAVFAGFIRSGGNTMICLNAMVVIGVFFSLVGIATSYSFLGMNKNGMGSTIACQLLIAVETWFRVRERKHRYLVLLAIGIIMVGLFMSLSRGAWLGAFTGLIVIVVLRRQFRVLFNLGVVIVPVLAICWNLLPQEKQEYAVGFDSKRENIRLRYASVDIARDYYEKSPLYGQGVGLRKMYDATNLAWLTLAETGILGLVTLAWIHLTFFRMVWQTQKQLSREDSFYSFLAIGAALICYKLVHGMVDHYWSRGSIMMAWTTAGMATGAYYQVCQRSQVGGELS